MIAFPGLMEAMPISGANWLAIKTKIPIQYQIGIPIKTQRMYFMNKTLFEKNEKKLPRLIALFSLTALKKEKKTFRYLLGTFLLAPSFVGISMTQS